MFNNFFKQTIMIRVEVTLVLGANSIWQMTATVDKTESENLSFKFCSFLDFSRDIAKCKSPILMVARTKLDSQTFVLNGRV